MEVLLDCRLGNTPRYYLGEKDDSLMLVPDEIRKCVVYLTFRDKNNKQRLAGTGFFVGIHGGTKEELAPDFPYLITAKHVIDGINEKSVDRIVSIRINNKDGSVIPIDSSVDQWKYHPTLSKPKSEPSFVDVAVLPWQDNGTHDNLWLPSTMAITPEIFKKNNIGYGEEVFITGLFTEHYGKQRNLPIIRIGNIIAMPEEPVLTDKRYGEVDAYLIEARSTGGLSGSPVFVNLGTIRTFDDEIKVSKTPIFYWLGLIHGHFDYKDSLLADSVTTDNLYNMSINMGIAVVIPVSRILEVLNQKEFIDYRNQQIELYNSTRSATLDSDSSST
jgi:hypothetical protein